jgi:hypothetical protein
MEVRMSRFKKPAGFLTTFILLALVACAGGTPTTDPAQAITEVWETVQVAQTMTALSSSPTPSATITSTVSPTLLVTNTPLITSTPLSVVPSATAYTIPTQGGLQSGSCDNADFIDDITIPDGATVTAGSEFVKTWRFKNLGPCTWTTSYDLVFSRVSDSGSDGVFKKPAPVDFPDTILPGEEMDISVTLTAPTIAETYQVFFVLQNDEGFNIPLRNENTYEFYVLFVVK